ncbi:MAG: DNA/RNA non-specific endonuclease [Clostridia bacterium]|nr:DNA/RNA non-specific endonuclease [Clostridia bacterium]
MKRAFSFIKFLTLITALILCFTACSIPFLDGDTEDGTFLPGTSNGEKLLEYEIRNDNKPYFTETEITSTAFENYSPLDSLGRCGVVTACIGKETMPKNGEERGEIGSVKPSGWIQASYDCVPGKYLYHRSHLIGWQLTAENANEKNLITGTEFMNTDGMLPFENQIAAYIKATGNHVMYRVTPDFRNNNLVANGVLIEAISVEDNGKGICFCVYVFNHQPGVSIDYSTGRSRLSSPSDGNNTDNSGNNDDGGEAIPEAKNYILNTNSMKFHKDTCASGNKTSAAHRQDYYGFREDLINEGYNPCAVCNP